MAIPATPVRRSLTVRGFTLIEIMVTLVILAVVVGVLSRVMYSAVGSKSTTSNGLESSQLARVAADMITRDLQNAGYGKDRDWNAAPQPSIAYIDSLQVLINANLQGDVDAIWDTTAYNPAGNPKPFPLAGTAWTPPIKYRTRAETIRWTFDTNNNGAITSDDMTTDARRTKNPNDYMLVRQVYGDSIGGAGNNGGVTEPVSLLLRPAASGVPPLFTVYLFGDPNPWNWSNGPIPANRLKDIARIVVKAVASSPKPDWRGRYSRTDYETEVAMSRNTMNLGGTEYAVDGFVYVDQNSNGVKDAGDLAVPGAAMHLKSFTTFTDVNGYYQFAVVAGTYTLKHSPPPGYANATSPDSFVVTVGPPATRSFKDVAVAGGNAAVSTFDDLNSNGTLDAGEPPLSAVQITLSSTSEIRYTDASGMTSFFVPVGAYTLTVTPPPGYIVTSTHPYSNSMISGGSASVAFGLTATPTGTIAGKVFADNNRNGVLDAGESGVPSVWVGITPNGGLTVVGFQYTNASGDYNITVPINNPPGTQPYSAMITVPNGYYPTTTTSLGSILVSSGQNITGKNFGVASFQVITLNASRVLSLGSADLVEKDWAGNDNQWDTKGHQDADIVLGADAGGTDNIAVWFNNYNGSPLFDANPTYTRNAPNSVLSMRLEMLDKNSPTTRYDAITGTKYTATGNFFVWFAQNTGGNLGYFSAAQNLSYTTADLGDVQSVLTYDCGGSAEPDIIVGTKSPSAGQGHIEVWLNNGATNPTFARDEIYPPQGNMSGNNLGEVTAMALADLDLDGDKDLVVCARTGSYTGQLIVLENTGRVNGARFKEKTRMTLTDEVPTAVLLSDVDGDGLVDIVTGSQVSASSGRMEQWNNLGSLSFLQVRQVVAPGIVLSLAAADMGGITPRDDIIAGYRTTDTGYGGGVIVYYMDYGVIPPFGSDPSGGALNSMVPALTINNFNYGVQPSTPSPPYLKDFAAGVKTGPTTGALFVFVR